jgi:hypothetical protein
VIVDAILASRRWFLALALASGGFAFADESERATLTVRDCVTSGIDARERDRAFPGAATVDAVHRSVLLRCPSAAMEVARAVGNGLSIERAELVLDHAGSEIVPGGYTLRAGLSEGRWRGELPRWHLVGWALRRPWTPDEALGPTFNAFVKDLGYWTRYGAGDVGNDRYSPRFGPVELSQTQPTARLDVSAILSSPAFGSDIVTRATVLADCGILLRKLETYDFRYRDWADAYEWNVATGGHGLRFANLRLVLTVRREPEGARGLRTVGIPAPVDVAAVAETLRRNGRGGSPTALLPTSAEFSVLAARHAATDSRVRELAHIGGGAAAAWMDAVERKDYEAYRKLISNILSTPPRYWKGWSIHDDLLVWFLYRNLLPQFVQDHIRTYWESWLMPDIPTSRLFHPQSKENLEYWEAAQDWRGRTSFFRGGYNYAVSTQNFNHTAVLGALLGGEIAQSQYAIEDGRNGLENLLLRFWTFLDGSTQEMLDHYYLSITLSGQKMLADFAPTPIDRLMARVALDRSIDLLASSFHPNLKRIVAPSGRTNLQSVLVRQDGIYGALHAISKKGTLKYLDRPLGATVEGMSIWGDDFPPGRVAMQGLAGGWASDWVSRTVDDKPLPFEDTAAETTRGAFTPPLWRRTYLGKHYALSSQDLKDGVVDVIGQWNSRAEPSESLEDLGTLTVRYVLNDANMSSTMGGQMTHAGSIATFQHRNHAVTFTKPTTERDRLIQLAGKDGLKTLATVIALWNFRPDPGWEIRVDGERITQLPAPARAGQVITIRDGVTYLGIIPLKATDLGRKDEIVIARGEPGATEPNGARIQPALTITSYNMQRSELAVLSATEWDTINTRAHGGFAIEIGDIADYGDFESFTRRMQTNRVEESWNDKDRVVEVKYRSGNDLMEAAFGTTYRQSNFPVVPGEQTKAFPYRRVNGKWPYLPAGIERDTTFAQQGTTGRLQKNGATLVTDAGRKAYLQTQPDAGVFTGYNPLPDSTSWSLSVPGGITLEARGKVSLLRVSIQPKEGRIWIDYASKDDQHGPEMATELRLTGMRTAPVVTLNGRLLSSADVRAESGGFLLPLADPPFAPRNSLTM